MFSAKKLCRAAVIAALYVALTYAFGALAYGGGFVEIRPAEALTVLPLFYPEAVPALWVGCMLANLASPFIMYDVPIGGLATLIASLLTYLCGRFIKNKVAKMAVGGLFPVIVNAAIIPVIIVVLCQDLCGQATVGAAYLFCFASLLATEAIWVYGLGIPLYTAVDRLRKKGVSVFLDGKEKKQSDTAAEPNTETNVKE